MPHLLRVVKFRVSVLMLITLLIACVQTGSKNSPVPSEEATEAVAYPTTVAEESEIPLITDHDFQNAQVVSEDVEDILLDMDVALEDDELAIENDVLADEPLEGV